MTLADQIITDLDVFFNDAEFAVAAKYIPAYTAIPPCNVAAIALGYPTIITAPTHGFTPGDKVSLAGFLGDDTDQIEGRTFDVIFPTLHTFAIDVDTNGLDISVGLPEPAASASTPLAVETKVLFNRENGAALGMGGAYITIIGKTSVFQVAKPGDAIIIATVQYTIKEPPVHDATGLTEIELTLEGGA